MFRVLEIPSLREVSKKEIIESFNGCYHEFTGLGPYWLKMMRP